MMNELADRLENLSHRIELAHVEQDSKTVICSLNDLNQEVWKSREAILKALRFAGCMEKLMPHMPGFWIEKGVCRCAFDAVAGDASVRTIVNGADYYSAARKAVDALEKGESDGK